MWFVNTNHGGNFTILKKSLQVQTFPNPCAPRTEKLNFSLKSLYSNSCCGSLGHREHVEALGRRSSSKNSILRD